MKKYFKFMSLMLCMMAGALAFVACGDDNEATPNSGDADTSITAQDILGSWYGIDEDTSKKIAVFGLEFKAGGSGTYSLWKAKAENDWQPYGGSVPMTWTLSDGTLTMQITDEKGQQATMRGDILGKTADGNLRVKRYIADDNGTVTSTDVVTVYRLSGGDQGFLRIMQSLISKY